MVKVAFTEIQPPGGTVTEVTWTMVVNGVSRKGIITAKFFL